MQWVCIIGCFIGITVLVLGWVRFGTRGEAFYLGSGRWFYNKLPDTVLRRIEDVRKLRMFQVAAKETLLQKEREKIVRLLGVSLCIFTLLQGIGAMVSFKELRAKPKQNIYLKRDDYDGEELDYSLFVALQGQDKDKLTLSVSPRTYQEEELNQMFERGFQDAWEQVLGDNESYTDVQKPLHILQELPDSPMEVSLWWEEDNYVDEEGELQVDSFVDGTQMQLYLELSYQGQKRQQQMPIILRKPVYTKKELLLQKIKDTLSSLESKDTTTETVVIPAKLHGVSLTVEEEKTPMLYFLLAGILFPGLLWLKKWQNEQNQRTMRSAQLKEDYPKLLYKMVLYMGAGITMKGCFEAISREWAEKYGKDDSSKGFKKTKPRYLQMEIYALVQQLGMGIPELTCYEEWGKQLNEPQYLKLTNMIMKNLSKGSDKLLSTMKQERNLALREHREQMKKRGEEASTRLLFPMLLLLLTAMLIVLVPAFFQFM